MMNARERYLAVYSDENRKKLDRVPTFVQYIKSDFYKKHKKALLTEYRGNRIWFSRFMAPLSLGFDAVFADIPPSIIALPVKVKTEEGRIAWIGMDGQIRNLRSTFYNKGIFYKEEVFERVREHLRPVRAANFLRWTIKWFERLSPHIFPIPMIGGIFDKVWMSMGMVEFAKNYRKNTKLYRELIRYFGEIMIANVQGLIDATGGRAGIVNFLDDVAFKGHSMIPPDRWESDFGSYYQTACSMISDAGMVPQLHSDGDITCLIPSFQKMGFRGLQGWEGGCNPVYINDHFPDFVVVGFGDVSETLPFGTKTQIYAHVKSLMDTFKENRHYVFGPSTVIVKEIPLENVRHFMDACFLYGKYGK